MNSKFRVIGAGIWGLAFSDYLLELGHSVNIFCRDTALDKKNLNEINLSKVTGDNIKPLHALDDFDANDSINILAVNSLGFRDVLEQHNAYFSKCKRIVSLTKGIDHEKGILFHEIVDERLGSQIEYGLISGPSFAKDLSEKKNISVSFASKYSNLSNIMVKATKSNYFNMVPTSSLIHIEFAGILKNIAAIVSAMSDKSYGLGVHTNKIIKIACDETLKMVNELTNIKSSHHSDKSEDIVMMPGFIGDMILTCKQDKSRNYQFGSLIADKTISIKQAKEMVGTVEGFDCCTTLVEKSPYTEGSLTKLLYEILHCENSQREELLTNFLQT